MNSITYGIGGKCESCDETHDHPLNNIIEVVKSDEPIVEQTNVQALAEALTQLPEETLNALKQALGL